jgi:prevent-host-death family protein
MSQLPAPTSNTRFSEDVVPLGDLKLNPGRVVQHTDTTQRPVLLTNHGRGVAVLKSLRVYEAQQDELAFMRAVVAGLADADAGRTISLEAAKTELGLP